MTNVADANREMGRRFRADAARIRERDEASGSVSLNPDGSSVVEWLEAKAARLEAMQAALDAKILGERE